MPILSKCLGSVNHVNISIEKIAFWFLDSLNGY